MGCNDMLKRRLGAIMLIALAIISVIVIYVIDLSYLLLTKPSDILWLNQVTNPSGAENSILFSFIAWFFWQFSITPVYSIRISAGLVLALLPLTTFYLLRRVSRDLVSSFVGALLVILFPSYSWLICTSNYHILLGLSLTSLAFSYLLEDNINLFRRIIIISVLGFLISLSDILSALVFFTSSLILWFALLLHQKRFSLEEAYPLFSAASLIPLAFFKIHVAKPPIMPLPMIIGMLMSVPAIIMLVRERKRYAICLWFFSSILVATLTHFSLVIIYVALPMIVLLSMLFKKCSERAVILIEEKEELNIELDLSKIVGLLLLLLLFASSIISTSEVLRGVKSEMEVYVARYGYEDLIDALEWIKKHTPEGTTILAEHPLDTWVKAYTNRPTLGNYLTKPGRDMEEFIRSYDADTVLNSNFEIRNNYLRLRDWEPVAPQRAPSFASSKGEEYLDFLYIDENHANVKYIFRGETLKPDFYSYEEKNTFWLIRNNEQVTLQHTYILRGNVVIVKRLFLGREPEAVVEYNITSVSSKIEAFSIKMWIPKDRKIGFIQVSGNKCYFILDSGEYVVEFQGNLKSLSFGPDEVWFQNRILAVFEQINNQIFVRIAVKVLKPESITWMRNEVFSTSAKEILTRYKVGYLVVPTIVKKTYMDRFGLDDQLFKSQYENNKLTIYMVRV